MAVQIAEDKAHLVLLDLEVLRSNDRVLHYFQISQVSDGRGEKARDERRFDLHFSENFLNLHD